MANQGILQAQLKVKNSMNLENGFIDNPLLKSVEGEINLTDENSFKGFASNTAIEHLDTIKSSSQNAIDLTNSLNNLSNLKYAKLEGNFNSNVEGKFSGNTAMQKLDLSQDITIKPNDLAENESLRELPKLDYSNPDLTDIITNDINLKPTTIDLSNQNNTNKLGIHGDSTHQLGNLEFVKVNTEAPFDNQITPQIDVSYTSLDRNGLVNLFNTMPYNVGYATVGSPTITDGVASGFSSSDHLETSISFLDSYKENFDIVICAKKGSVSSQGEGSLFCLQNGNPAQGKFTAFFWGNNFKFQSATETGYSDSITLTATFDSNTFYYLKISQRNRTVTLSYSTDGITWQGETSLNDFSQISVSFPIRIGCNSSWATGFAGEIDLNHTYIKINSIVSTGPVNYTIVGSPTIVNGIVSGFSTSDYLTVNAFPIVTSDWEIRTKAITEGNSSTQQRLLRRTDSFMIRCYTYWQYYNGTAIRLGPDTTYTPANYPYLWLKKQGTTITALLSADGTNWETVKTDLTLSSTLQDGQITFSSNSSPWLGSIDLKETYIKVNGELWFGHESKMVTWFNGQPSMSKTIDITSAAGTNSLTNDDKAIVTNKGWTITGV